MPVMTAAKIKNTWHLPGVLGKTLCGLFCDTFELIGSTKSVSIKDSCQECRRLSIADFMPQGGETTMKQGYYWATMKTGIASEIVWVTGRTSPSVYRIRHKPPFEASEFKDFEFINDGYRPMDDKIKVKSCLYISSQGPLDSTDKISQGVFSDMTASMVADKEFPPSLIVDSDLPEFHIGQSYENKPAQAIQCTQCGQNQFNVGRGSFYTAIRCVYCKWELCLHDG